VVAVPGLQFLSHLQANAQQVKKKQKACILMWMGGGPPTIDLWDLKPGSKNGGEFKPIKTAAPSVEISEHLPETAKQFKNLSIIRSMSTREADHGRGRYFMHTAFVPNPTVVHPTFGSVVSHELGGKRPELEIPSFVSIDGGGRWVRMKANMPAVPVTDLVIHPREADLVVATFGRGLFITHIGPLREIDPNAFDQPLQFFPGPPRAIPGPGPWGAGRYRAAKSPIMSTTAWAG